MATVNKHTLPPTALMPNSPLPLLHYPGILATKINAPLDQIYDVFDSNGWQVQWIYRYGKTQHSHYHSQTHECMVVLSGHAIVRFGVADTVSDLEESTFGNGKEDGGVEIEAHVGDVFVIPAGVAHKTFSASPESTLKLLTPGNGHGVAADDVRAALAGIEISGFTMMGAYPCGSGEWDFAKGGESEGMYERVWAVRKPEFDPVLGKAEEGLCGQW